MRRKRYRTADEHYEEAERLLEESKSYPLDTYEAATLAAQSTAHFEAAKAIIAKKAAAKDRLTLGNQRWGGL